MRDRLWQSVGCALAWEVRIVGRIAGVPGWRSGITRRCRQPAPDARSRRALFGNRPLGGGRLALPSREGGMRGGWVLQYNAVVVQHDKGEDMPGRMLAEKDDAIGW